MTWQTLGELTLNLSFVLYCVWFFPQLLLNAKRQDTRGLSYLMHALLFVGYFADLMYGFGRHMQWQYRAVTVIGLCCLALQHYQIARYGLRARYEKQWFYAFTLAMVALLVFAILQITIIGHSKTYYDIAGLVSGACWFLFSLPQIVVNFRHRSTQGLSISFVVISLLICIFDNISAWALGWDYPSKIGLPLTLLKKGLLLGQMVYYRRQVSSRRLDQASQTRSNRSLTSA